MAYSELIKNFESIRDYMREFYVYGFRRRGEVGVRSARSYDNERRRIESWLGEYMSFTQSASGRAQFLSVDSRDILYNPFFQAFRAKSFTDKDIILHFYLLDLLGEETWLTFREVVDGLYESYFDKLDHPPALDESTIRNKLKEYVALGLLEQKKEGKSICYRKAKSGVDLSSWEEAVTFFSEENPLGVIGSFLLARKKSGNAAEIMAADDVKNDAKNSETAYFRFRHHYMLYALDSQVLYDLLDAMSGKCAVEVAAAGRRRQPVRKYALYPVKIFISTQTGREYLLAYEYEQRRLSFFRLDHIKSVKKGRAEKNWESYERRFEKFGKHLWGVSAGQERRSEHLEMTIAVCAGEEYIVQRLNRERRNGRVERVDEGTYRYVTDMRDATEMLPWIRTFIGRIVKLECSNPAVIETYENDMKEMGELYDL